MPIHFGSMCGLTFVLRVLLNRTELWKKIPTYLLCINVSIVISQFSWLNLLCYTQDIMNSKSWSKVHIKNGCHFQVRIYVNVHTHVYIYIYAHIYIHIYKYIHINICVFKENTFPPCSRQWETLIFPICPMLTEPWMRMCSRFGSNIPLLLSDRESLGSWALAGGSYYPVVMISKGMYN